MATAKTPLPRIDLESRSALTAAIESGQPVYGKEGDYANDTEVLLNHFHGLFSCHRTSTRIYRFNRDFVNVSANKYTLRRTFGDTFPNVYTQLFDYAAGHVFTHYDAETGGVSFINGVRQGDEKRLCIREAFNDLNPEFFKDVTDTACRIAEDLVTGVTPETIRADARYFLDVLAPRWKGTHSSFTPS